MYCGIDIGTGSVKAVLVDGGQKVMASSTSALTVSRPKPGWSEQNPDDWWRATLDVLDGLAADAPKELAAVKAIGLSGQMHGATLLGRDGRPLRPCMLWNDGRAASECGELESAEPRFRGLGGNIAMPGFTAPKLAWIRKHEPEVFKAIHKVLLPKDYIRLKLSGEMASDMSDSAGTLWMDVAARDWADPLLAATGLSRDHMPRLVEGTQEAGRLRSELGARWGMALAPVVAGGGGDNAASACGVGVVAPGSAFLSLGTSGVLFVANGRFSPNVAGAVHAFCHAVPDTWHQMGVVLSATACLDWLASVLREDAAALAEALGPPEGPAGLLFLPYLSGERTPHNDVGIRGAFAGIGHDTGREALTHAVMDGVAFALRDCRDALAAAGTRVAKVTAVGGGTRSRTWLSILANVLGVPVEVPVAGPQGAAFGAARLAMAAAKGGDFSEIFAPPPMRAAILPDPGLMPSYGAAFERWRALYPAARSAMG